MDSVKIYTVEMILSSMTLHFWFLSDTYTADISMTNSTGPTQACVHAPTQVSQLDQKDTAGLPSLLNQTDVTGDCTAQGKRKHVSVAPDKL